MLARLDISFRHGTKAIFEGGGGQGDCSTKRQDSHLDSRFLGCPKGEGQGWPESKTLTARDGGAGAPRDGSTAFFAQSP